MEDELLEPTEQEEPRYVQRPWWQVWGARIALVVFVVLLILYYINVGRGGQ